MGQLILVIWKFLRNHIHKQLQLNRISHQREESTQQRQRTRLPKRSRKGEHSDSASSTGGDDDKENQGLYLKVSRFVILHLLIFMFYRLIK